MKNRQKRACLFSALSGDLIVVLVSPCFFLTLFVLFCIFFCFCSRCCYFHWNFRQFETVENKNTHKMALNMVGTEFSSTPLEIISKRSQINILDDAWRLGRKKKELWLRHTVEKQMTHVTSNQIQIENWRGKLRPIIVTTPSFRGVFAGTFPLIPCRFGSFALFIHLRSIFSNRGKSLFIGVFNF